MRFLLRIAVIAFFLLDSTSAQSNFPRYHKNRGARINSGEIVPGTDQTKLYLDYLKGKNVGMVINQTSVIGKNLTLSVDSFLRAGITIKKIFGPEHGFRGSASNGASVGDTVDPESGIQVISLYGNKHYKPTPKDLAGIDLMVFDIQDVGTRFYTYLSTLQYVMEACAENNVELMILDRPNPNGAYVDGPVLDTAYRSFVGLNPIPIVYGLTVAEYAQMLNGEGWLKNHVKCKLKIVKVANYTHSSAYRLPVNPSPNLNTEKSVLLYPAMCLFEGTALSLGRGTLYPFLQIGHPALKGKYTYTFKPASIAGMSEDPPQKDKICYGIDIRNYNTNNIRNINLSLLLELYKAFPDKGHFFTGYFEKLAGTGKLRKQIEAGRSEHEIRASWEPELGKFKAMRKKYLLYP